jgi:hypothetical protein
MVKDDQLWLAVRAWSHKQIAWVRICMHEPVLKNHEVETLGNQLGQVF